MNNLQTPNLISLKRMAAIAMAVSVLPIGIMIEQGAVELTMALYTLSGFSVLGMMVVLFFAAREATSDFLKENDEARRNSRKIRIIFIASLVFCLTSITLIGSVVYIDFVGNLPEISIEVDDAGRRRESPFN